MPADEDTPRRSRVRGKDRIESFTGGVYGFAATLLVLDLAVHPPGIPLERVLHPGDELNEPQQAGTSQWCPGPALSAS